MSVLQYNQGKVKHCSRNMQFHERVCRFLVDFSKYSKTSCATSTSASKSEDKLERHAGANGERVHEVRHQVEFQPASCQAVRTRATRNAEMQLRWYAITVTGPKFDFVRQDT